MKKVKIFLAFIISVVILSVFSVCVSAAENDFSVRVKLSDIGNSGEYYINACGNNIFLPSNADIKKLTLVFGGGKEISYGKTGEQAYGKILSGDSADLSFAASKDFEGNECYDVTFYSGNNSARYIFYRDRSLPAVFVETSKGIEYIESSKDNRDKKAEITIISAEGKTEYSDKSEIKGRGNATWGYYKKPYQIKLSEKSPVLGMESAKTWILLADYVDLSHMHNALAFMLAKDLGIPYSIDYRYVNLYIDGDYKGIYLICEKVQINSGRVDIKELEKENEDKNPDVDFESLPVITVTNGKLISDTILTSYTYSQGLVSPEDITGGYLVELDNMYGYREPARFTTENGNTYVVKSPEFVSKDEMEYIASLFADMEEAIYSSDGYNKKGVHYSEYIDIESFAAVYTEEELLKNWDAYFSSMFFFKDADSNGKVSKIFMGPIWDMDNILGNLNFDTYATDTDFLWAQNGKFLNYVRALAAPLMSHSDFKAVVAEKYDTAYRKVKLYLSENGFINKTAEEISASVAMDRIRWETYDSDRWVLSSGGYRKVSTKFVHFPEWGSGLDNEPITCLGYLRSFLSKRADSLLVSIGKGKIDPPDEKTTETVVTTASSELPKTDVTVESSDNTSAVVPMPDDTKGKFTVGSAIVIAIAVIIVLASVLFVISKKRKN